MIKKIIKTLFVVIVIISSIVFLQNNNKMKYYTVTVSAKTYATGNGSETHIEGDLNHNGKIDLQDVILLLKKYLGIDDSQNELKAPTISYRTVGVEGDNTVNDIDIDYATYRIGENNANILDGWELYVTSDNAEGDEMTINGVGYFFHSDNGNETIRPALVDYGDTHRYIARVYKIVNGEKVYSDWSNIIEIKAELKAPTISYRTVGIEGDNTVNDIDIDYATYRIGENNANILDGWELYVTSDNAEGDEMTINGVGYFFHSDNGNETIRPALVDYGDTHRYIARVYKIVNGEKVYSDWSNIIEIKAELKAPTISYRTVGVEGDNTVNDIDIDYATYRIGENNANILDGWELYVTSDNAEGDEMTINGVGYFFHSDNGNETIRPALVDYGDTHRYIARVYKIVNGEKVYSDWSNIIEIKAELKAPTISYRTVGIEGDNTVNDIDIDYATYRIGENNANILDGWELYVTSDNAEGDEMTINGVGYFFHSDNGNETIRPALVDYGDTHRYIARVYKIVNGEKVYSDWSNIIEIKAELKAPTISYRTVGVEGDNTVNDIDIDYATYRIGENNANILDGWELYVTSDNAEGDEMTINGVGYFFHSDNGNETIRPALVDYGDTHRYIARVYKIVNGEKVYSDWSNIIEIKAEQ